MQHGVDQRRRFLKGAATALAATIAAPRLGAFDVAEPAAKTAAPARRRKAA